MTVIMHQPDKLFLTDGRTEIRYGDVAGLFIKLQSELNEIDRNKLTIGINTEDRLQAVLWMVLCWIQNIPFVPFHGDHPEPVHNFKTDIIADRIADIRDLLSHTDIFESGSGYGPGLSLFPDSFNHFDSFNHPDEAVLCGILTSGSSGEPGKVPIRRRQMIAAVNNAVVTGQMERIDVTNRSGMTDLWGNCLPLYHAGGLTIIFRALLTGTGIFIWDRFDVKTICRDLAEYPCIRRISLVPTMLKRILDYSQSSSRPVTSQSLKNVLVGGGPAPAGLIQNARDQGWPVIFSYGMTETCGQIAAQNVNGSSPSDSVGRPFPDHNVTVRNDSGHIVPVGKSGIIWIEGPQVFSGYLSKPDDLRESGLPDLRDTDSSDNDAAGADSKPSHNRQQTGTKSTNRINTGDFGHFDESGNLYIEARRTDLVISGGMNIRPVEIENVLLNCPYVSDAGVTGIPDEDWGQRLVALIVPAADAADLTGAELKSRIDGYLVSRLKSHQQPKSICLTDAIPRTSLGKIRRRTLLEMAINRLAEK